MSDLEKRLDELEQRGVDLEKSLRECSNGKRRAACCRRTANIGYADEILISQGSDFSMNSS